MLKNTRSYQANLIKIKGISGMLYRSKKPAKTLVIYGLGAPVVPDNGSLPDAPFIMGFDVDLLVPDYIGYGRSDGRFTPLNCIKTFLNLYNWVTKGCVGTNHYQNSTVKLYYQKVIFIGRSLGGTYVPLLPRFNPKIKEMGIIYPAVDNKSSGSIKGEESNEDFLRAMKGDGYHYLYRGILSKIWDKHLQNGDGLSPVDNIKYLENANLFIGHGRKDRCIHYSKSVGYYREIIQAFPNKINQFALKLYPDSGHDAETSNQTVVDFLEWVGVGRYNS